MTGHSPGRIGICKEEHRREAKYLIESGKAIGSVGAQKRRAGGVVRRCLQ